MAGPDERDLGSLPVDATEYLLECEQALRGLRVAWSVDLGYAPIEPEIGRICARAAQVFAAELGYVVCSTRSRPACDDLVGRDLPPLWAGLSGALWPRAVPKPAVGDAGDQSVSN